MPKVKICNRDQEITVDEGANLRSSLLSNGVAVHHDATAIGTKVVQYVNCKGFGHCGTCSVHVTKGMENCSPKGFRERIRLFFSFASLGYEKQVRLACQTRVRGDVEIEVQPPANLYGERFW